MFSIQLQSPEGGCIEILCEGGEYILDAAERQQIELPYSCRAGGCSSCACKVISGEYNGEDGSFLDSSQMANGYILACVTYPESDMVIATHVESEIF